ncbi:MAG: YdcF family protein [Alphaproteobacteria bacterium]|nr:YdcF family protein [Alphaproteobacteria bacterium]
MTFSGTIRKRRLRRKRYAALLVVIITAIALSIGFILFIRTVPESSTPASIKTQAIVVLTGGSLRLEAGLALLSANKGEKLFVSGVHRGVDVAELLRVSRQTPGALDCCIALGYAADNTRGNALETANWMKREGFTSMTLVTANYHMPRSLLEFRTAMPGAAIVPHPVFPSHVKLDNWWIWPGTVTLLAGEYSKFLLAWVRSTWQSINNWGATKTT